jgi:NADH:ubiquinone oxidoreductase subunit F (NADH-binding)
MAEYKLLTKDFGMDGIQSLAVYERSGGYEGLRKALGTMTPDELVEEVKTSRSRAASRTVRSSTRTRTSSSRGR